MKYSNAPWWKRLMQSLMLLHYNDIIMGAIASQITSLMIVYSIAYSDADQRKHQSSASLAFVRGIHRGPVNSPHKRPVTRKCSIWWRHHVVKDLKRMQLSAVTSDAVSTAVLSACWLPTIRITVAISCKGRERLSGLKNTLGQKCTCNFE